ncbi:hypothetical protein Bealeia1_01530 [Candidatus Bealeia paramacronuclearis]|uniref:Uncharacterized protein n=1 Tax=Candidatus Bealeia paramacronuclearis TaxID=1921001 RepID=A0ABZ2C5E5_9PROT|nr:hypothetical protein [Candidatus Bealeia paramacronuclearis]
MENIFRFVKFLSIICWGAQNASAVIIVNGHEVTNDKIVHEYGIENETKQLFVTYKKINNDFFLEVQDYYIPSPEIHASTPDQLLKKYEGGFQKIKKHLAPYYKEDQLIYEMPVAIEQHFLSPKACRIGCPLFSSHIYSCLMESPTVTIVGDSVDFNHTSYIKSKGLLCLLPTSLNTFVKEFQFFPIKDNSYSYDLAIQGYVNFGCPQNFCNFYGQFFVIGARKVRIQF